MTFGCLFEDSCLETEGIIRCLYLHVYLSHGSVPLLVLVSFFSSRDGLSPHDQVSGDGMGSEINKNSSLTTSV